MLIDKLFRLAVCGCLGLAGTGAAAAGLQITATTSSMGMLARVVGGDAVQVTVLAPPDRDAHTLAAKPSMMLALRRADLLVAVGADLEVGWLPAAIDGASNPRLQPGQAGYFEAAAHVPLIEAGQAADRSRGDVHPAGNPHLHLDPERMAQLAAALAHRLGELDRPHAEQFQANAAVFQKAVGAQTPRWKKQAAGAAGIVFFHKDGNYLAAWLGIPVLGYLEPLPGIPPTATHLRQLKESLQGKRGVVIFTSFQPEEGPRFLAEALGWKRVRLPLEPGAGAGTEDYLKLIDRWVAAVAESRP